MLAFGSALHAVRFCHAAQVALMFARWPPEAREVCGATEAAPDGRLLFAGPRFAMAVHDTYAYQCGPLPCHHRLQPASRSKPCITASAHPAPAHTHDHILSHS